LVAPVGIVESSIAGRSMSPGYVKPTGVGSDGASVAPFCPLTRPICIVGSGCHSSPTFISTIGLV
jgi:hypothetical protein